MIQVNNLVANYGDNVVLKNITLHVERHETMVIMGQSGCGKTTFLRHLVGLLKPASGEILIDGKDVAKMREKEFTKFSRSIGMLFQGGALFNSMTVGENVAFPVREHFKIADSVIDIMVKMKLELVGLPNSEKLMPAELSGGMRKRAGLARAMILDPRIIFLDEPTSGLDPIIAAGIDELILMIKKAFRTTMVVVSHDIESGFTIGDRIAIFHEGEVVELGTPEQVRNSSRPYVQQFIHRQPPKETQRRDSYLAETTEKR